MKKLKSFVYVLYKSLTSLNWYKDLVRTNPTFSLKYFLSLALLSVLISVSFNIPTILSVTGDLSRKIIDHLSTLYPEDLVITVNDSKLTINQPQPFLIPMPGGFKDTLIEGVEDADNMAVNQDRQNFIDGLNEIDNLVVFDAQGTLDDLERYKTFILINEVNILVRNGSRTQVFPLKDIPDGEFTVENYNRFLSTFRSVLNAFPYIIISILIFYGLVYYMGFRLLYLGFVGVVLLGLGRLMQINTVDGESMNYSRYFQIGVHTFTLPLIIEMILLIFGVPLLIPYWVFIVNIGFSLVVLNYLKKNTT